MFRIRYAEINDAKILAEIHSRSWKIAYKDIVPDEVLEDITAEKRQKYFEKALTNRLEKNAIIFKDNEAAGFICIGRCRDTDKMDTCGELRSIYLLPEYWNVGIGSELIKWGLNELKKRNYNHVTLWVLEENIRARKFYENIGFRHDGTVKEITIGKRLNEYRYEISLSI